MPSGTKSEAIIIHHVGSCLDIREAVTRVDQQRHLMNRFVGKVATNNLRFDRSSAKGEPHHWCLSQAFWGRHWDLVRHRDMTQIRCSLNSWATQIASGEPEGTPQKPKLMKLKPKTLELWGGNAAHLNHLFPINLPWTSQEISALSSFFPGSSFFSSFFLFQQMFSVKHGGLLSRFYDFVAFLEQALALMTHESAWCWLRVGVSSLELAWVVPHLHLFLSHMMSSAQGAFPHFSTQPIWFHPNVSQLLKSAKTEYCVFPSTNYQKKYKSKGGQAKMQNTTIYLFYSKNLSNVTQWRNDIFVPVWYMTVC